MADEEQEERGSFWRSEGPEEELPPMEAEADEEDQHSRLEDLTSLESFLDGGGSALPHLDDELASELASEGPPSWLGTRWRDIPAEEQQQAWIGLRQWVDWLIQEFQLPPQKLPACWFRHPAIVAELHAGMNVEYKVWEEGAPTLNPMITWLPHLQAMLARIQGIVANLTGCASGQHQEPEIMARDYDEDLWRATVYSRREQQQISRAEEDAPAQRMRARLVNSDGDELASTPAIEPAPIQGPEEPQLHVSGERIPGTSSTTITVVAENISADDRIVWETSTSEEPTWKPLDDDEDDESGSDAQDDSSDDQ